MLASFVSLVRSARLTVGRLWFIKLSVMTRVFYQKLYNL